MNDQFIGILRKAKLNFAILGTILLIAVVGKFLEPELTNRIFVTADQLVSASSPVAGEVQLHEMAMEGNVMKMRQVKDIAVPSGGEVELKPGGLHLMFMNIKAPLAAGETIPVKVKFAKAGEVEDKMPVNAMGGHGGQGPHGGAAKY